jgi:hypothetical protein
MRLSSQYSLLQSLSTPHFFFRTMLPPCFGNRRRGDVVDLVVVVDAATTPNVGSDSDDGGGAVVLLVGGVGSGMVFTNLCPIGSTDGKKATTLVVVDHKSNIRLHKNDGVDFMTCVKNTVIVSTAR